MEYPFKDLLPLDEVLEREGYYKDWTHLDPKVFYSLTQISNFIKTKGFGVDVRLLIAQLAEHFGLKTNQVVELANLLQDKFDNLEGVTSNFTSDINGLVAQMQAEKDAIIANATVDSEVILARGGKPTLQARLDETTAHLAQIAVSATSFGAKGDGVSDDSLSLQATFDYATTNNKAVVLNGDYLVSKDIVIESDFVKIIGNSSRIIRDYSSIVTDGSILKIAGKYTEKIITSNINVGDTIINTNSQGLKAGDIVYIITDEVYTQRGKSGTYYNKGFASRVVRINSSTQIRIADRIPYSFNASNNLRLRKTNAGVCDIDKLTLEFTGSYGSKRGTGLNLNYISNANIDIKISNASLASAVTVYTYNGSITVVDGVGATESIGLNYGVMTDGAYGTEFKLHCTTARHPMTFTGIPSYDAIIKDSVLTSLGVSDGVSLDAHCAGKVDIINSKLPQGAKISGGEYKFHNCKIGSNGLSPTTCIQRRDSTFFKSLTVDSCEIEFHGAATYIYDVSPDDFLLEYGDFIFKNNTIRAKNALSNYNILSFSGVAVTPNKVGNFIIKDNEFLLPASSSLHVLYVSDTAVSLKAGEQGVLTVQNNIFNGSLKMTMGTSGSLSEKTADTFFKKISIKDNSYNNAGLFIDGFKKAKRLEIIKNKVDYVNSPECELVFFEDNKTEQITPTFYSVSFANSVNVFLKNNILLSKQGATTTFFYIPGVTNLYFENLSDVTGVSYLLEGTPTNYASLARLPFSEWSKSHIVMGKYHIWVDAVGRLRIKNSPPTSEADGALIGTQT